MTCKGCIELQSRLKTLTEDFERVQRKNDLLKEYWRIINISYQKQKVKISELESALKLREQIISKYRMDEKPYEIQSEDLEE